MERSGIVGMYVDIAQLMHSAILIPSGITIENPMVPTPIGRPEARS